MRRFAGLLAAVALLVPSVARTQAVQGIKVHGHWVIEVRNADGTLAQRAEFENALVDFGKTTLATLLNGQVPFDFWQIQIDGNLCRTDTGAAISCILAEAANTSSFPYLFKNLTKSVVGATFVLQGSFVAAADGQVGRVTTFTARNGGGLGFTSTVPSTTIAVQATQTVSVTVTISFS